jgi:hypothetical protein
MADRTKTVQQQIDAMQGEITALAFYLRAALDKHPRANEALDMAEAELERMTAVLLQMPFADEMFDGIDRVKKDLGRPPHRRQPSQDPKP